MTNKSFLRPIDLARAIGTGSHMVRRYEEWGFLPPVERGENGYRRYQVQHLRALQTARLLVAGYGWEPARQMMQYIYQGERATLLATIDAFHAHLHQRRQEIEATLKAFREIVEKKPQLVVEKHPFQQSEKLPIRKAAQLVGVRPSAIRFWEDQKLLYPERDQQSGYRLYDEKQLLHLQIIVLLREVGYDFDAIRAVLAEVAIGQIERAIRAAEQRHQDLLAESERGSAATAAAWHYFEEWTQGDTHTQFAVPNQPHNA